MQQRVAPRLDRIVTVSEASRSEIERYFGIPEKEIRVVYNGTDSEIFRLFLKPLWCVEGDAGYRELQAGLEAFLGLDRLFAGATEEGPEPHG